MNNMHWVDFGLGAAVSGCIGLIMNYALHYKHVKELKRLLAGNIEYENLHKQFVADVGRSLEDKEGFHF